MAVYRYKATKERVTDFGTIVATDIDEALAKLNQLGFTKIRLERITGIAAIWKRFTANIK